MGLGKEKGKAHKEQVLLDSFSSVFYCIFPHPWILGQNLQTDTTSITDFTNLACVLLFTTQNVPILVEDQQIFLIKIIWSLFAVTLIHSQERSALSYQSTATQK